MKIERINENQIKCTLTRSDLASHHLKISELAYGSEKTQDLLKDMMEQASDEVGFDAKDLPLMIEAIPVSMDCIVLMITKVENPEDAELAVPNFTGSEDFIFPGMREPTAVFSEDADTFINGLTEKLSTIAIKKLYSFDDLDTVIDLAHHVSSSAPIGSRLYKNRSNKRYYLLIDKNDCDIREFGTICNSALEYGSRETLSFARAAYMDEHFEVIIAKDALPNLANV